jgi:hypothetical protein
LGPAASCLSFPSQLTFNRTQFKHRQEASILRILDEPFSVLDSQRASVTKAFCHELCDCFPSVSRQVDARHDEYVFIGREE